MLNKRGRLTASEWEQIKEHPSIGARLTRSLEPWLGDWVRGVGEHHERWDGDGYPAGLRGTEISLAARIIAVADAFDVMTAARSYKEPLPAEAARTELVRCAGTQFDEEVVRAFVAVSIGKLRRTMGPSAALAQIPVVGSLLARPLRRGGRAPGVGGPRDRGPGRPGAAGRGRARSGSASTTIGRGPVANACGSGEWSPVRRVAAPPPCSPSASDGAVTQAKRRRRSTTVTGPPEARRS